MGRLCMHTEDKGCFSSSSCCCRCCCFVRAFELSSCPCHLLGERKWWWWWLGVGMSDRIKGFRMDVYERTRLRCRVSISRYGRGE